MPHTMRERVTPELPTPSVGLSAAADGALVLANPDPLVTPPPSIGSWVQRWADERPNDVAFAQRDGDGWRTIEWSALLRRVESAGQALIDRGLSLDRPLVILSGNSIDHMILGIASMLAGVPYVPVSVAYSLRSSDHGLLRSILDLVTPGAVFVEDADIFSRALAVVDADTEVIAATTSGRGQTALASLVETRPGRSWKRARKQVRSDTVAKILMTSGSTGRPKGVLTTHGMLTSNQEAIAKVWPFLEEEPPVLVDWLPWSHTFGGSHNANMVLRNGGTMYIDDGRPSPDLVGDTFRNLSEVAPTLYFNVPAGYAMLADRLEVDEQLRNNFFSQLSGIFYAGAALPQDTWDRLDVLAEQTLGARLWLTTAWGATETAPLTTSAHFASDDAGNIGVPVPGCSLKLMPTGEKFEVRVKGPNVTPGYHRNDAATQAAFDDEGWYQIGDAVQFVERCNPARGLLFAGRVSEDFKLATGSWVHVGSLRTQLLSSCGGLLTNAVIVGADRDEVCALAWLSPAAEALAGQDVDPTRAQAVHEVLQARLARHNARAVGSSRKIARVLLLASPPSLDRREITDKGYVNAHAVVTNRGADVERCYDGAPHPDVVDTSEHAPLPTQHTSSGATGSPPSLNPTGSSIPRRGKKQ